MTAAPTTPIPDWRKNAKPGVPLALAKPPEPAPGVAPGKNQPTILQYIRPSARDRWMATQIAYYTPTNVENICRGALSGNLTAQWMMFDLMEQTWPRLQKNLNEIKNGAKSLNRIVRPYADKDEKPTAEAVRRAKIVDKLLRTMRPDRKKNERDLDDTIYDTLDALGKGIELSQVLWEQRQVKIGAAGNLLWAPRATQWVHPRYYGYPPGTGYEEQLMLNAREVALSNPEFKAATNDLWLPIPDDEFIVSIIQQKSGHPVSSSLLRTLAMFWAFQNFTWEWFLNFAQIFGAPIRWATYDPATSTSDTINTLMSMLGQMGSMGWAAFPAGTQLELKEAMKSATDNPQKLLLDACDLICDLMVLGQTLTSGHGGSSMGGGGGGGSRALGQVHQDIRSERIQSAANSAAKILSETLIRAICRLNFGDDSECPELLIVTKANKNLVQQAQRWQILMQIPGAEYSKQQFYEDNELSQPDESGDVLVAQAPGAAGGNAQEDAQQLGKEETAMARAHAGNRPPADAQLVNRVLEDLTGVQHQWLAGVKPFFQELIAQAKSGSVSDAEFLRTLTRAQKELPDLFHRLDSKHLATAMENALSAAAVNGVARGVMKRGGGR